MAPPPTEARPAARAPAKASVAPVSRDTSKMDELLAIARRHDPRIDHTDAHNLITELNEILRRPLIIDTLYRHAALEINRSSEDPAHCEAILGLEQFDKVVDIDQSPIGRTPRSNPATYTQLFTPIRELFGRCRL